MASTVKSQWKEVPVLSPGPLQGRRKWGMFAPVGAKASATVIQAFQNTTTLLKILLNFFSFVEVQMTNKNCIYLMYAT